MTGTDQTAGTHLPIGMGFWIKPAYNAGNFTGSGSMTWTVEVGDVTTYQASLIGKTMTVVWKLDATSVGGTPSTGLYILVPGGYAAKTAAFAPAYVVDNGGAAVWSSAHIAAGQSVIGIDKTLAGGNWSASTNATYIYGEITFEVH